MNPNEEELNPARVESPAEYLTQISRPEKIANSIFHEYLNKDFVVSQLNEWDVEYIRRVCSLIAVLEYCGFKTTAQAYHFDIEVLLNAKRSINGKERELQVTTIQKMNKTVGAGNSEPLKKGW